MISETELIVPALQALSRSPDGKLLTGQLREEVKKTIKLSRDDLVPLRNRPDTRIDQRIRNLKSHKKNLGNPFLEGLMEEIPRGMCITDKGRMFLRSKGRGST